MVTTSIDLVIQSSLFDDLVPFDLLQEKIWWDRGGNDLNLLPAFVQGSFMPFHPIHPLIDTLLTRPFAEGNPKEKRLRLRVLNA